MTSYIIAIQRLPHMYHRLRDIRSRNELDLEPMDGPVVRTLAAGAKRPEVRDLDRPCTFRDLSWAR